MATFTAQINDWVLATKERQTAVLRQSTQELVNDMQKPVSRGGRMPVDTGFLRSSLTPTRNPTPQRNPDTGPVSQNDAVIVAAIAGMETGTVQWFSYAANYAAHVEYGARGRPPRRFVGGAVQKWRRIVNRVAARLQRRAGG